MAQLEQLFQASFSVTASDTTSHVVTGFPVIPAGSSALIVGVYFYFLGTYSNNISSLGVNDGTNLVPVFLSGSGTIANNSTPIISSNSQFIMNAGDILQYTFTNDNTGTLDISVFYRLIGGQSNPDSLIYSAIKSNATGSSASLVIPSIGTNIAFYKSLILTNTGPTQNFGLELSNFLKQMSVTTNTSSILISGTEYLYQTTGNELGIITVTTTFSYYLSYYYDPLYTP